MDDAREKFVHFMWGRSAIRVDDGPSSWSPHIYESLIDTAYYIICSYIRKERDDDKEFGMGRLERQYLCTDEFMTVADAQRWIDENRELNDMGISRGEIYNIAHSSVWKTETNPNLRGW